MSEQQPEDYELAQFEQQLADIEAQQGQLDPASVYPSPEKKDSQLLLFRDIIKATDSKKISNPSTQELGKSRMGVRDYLHIATFLDSQGIPKLADYFRQDVENVLATALSHKALLIHAIITQIKKEQKLAPPADVKKKWFNDKPKEEQHAQIGQA